MSTREIITIQCGHYSNFIGTHWWNLQESAFNYDQASTDPKEVETDCTFREGLTLNGQQTYTPRLIAVDLSGSLKTLNEEGRLYHHPQQPDHSTWQGKLERHNTESPQKNSFLTDLEALDLGKMPAEDMESKLYELQSSVEVWSDFLRIHLHPKSIQTVDVAHHSNNFQVYPAGRDVWNTKFKEVFEERVHFFVEECDSFQGFQLLVDGDDGFGGLGSCLAEELADEFSQKGRIAFLSSPKTRPLDQEPHLFHSTLLNQAMCLNDISNYCSLTIPLSHLTNPWRSHTQTPPRALPYDPSLPFLSSAVLASALETASLVYRVATPPLPLPSLGGTLGSMGRKVCGMGLCLPLPLPEDSSLLSELDSTPLHSQLRPLTPFCQVEDTRWSQAISLRGIPSSYPLCFPTDHRYSYSGSHISLALSDHLSRHFPPSSTSTHFTAIHKPLAIKNPFPSSILPDHYYTSRQVPVCASYQSQSGIGRMFSALSVELERLDVKKVPVFASTCLDADSYTDLKDSLVTMEGCYATQLNLDDSTDSD